MEEILSIANELSNICAGIGGGQMMVLDEHVERRRAIHALYMKELGNLPGISVFDNPSEDWQLDETTNNIEDVVEVAASLP